MVDAFIIIKYPSLPLIRIFVLESNLSNIYSHFSSLLIAIGMVYVFPSFYVQPICVFKFKVYASLF